MKKPRLGEQREQLYAKQRRVTFRSGDALAKNNAGTTVWSDDGWPRADSRTWSGVHRGRCVSPRHRRRCGGRCTDSRSHLSEQEDETTASTSNTPPNRCQYLWEKYSYQAKSTSDLLTAHEPARLRGPVDASRELRANRTDSTQIPNFAMAIPLSRLETEGIVRTS